MTFSTEADPATTARFAEVGDCYYEHKLWPEALDVLTDLAATEYATDEVSLYAKLAACNHALGNWKRQRGCTSRCGGLARYVGMADAIGEVSRAWVRRRSRSKCFSSKCGSYRCKGQQKHRLKWPWCAVSSPQRAPSNDGQLSFFDEMGAAPIHQATSSAKRARMNYNREQRLKLESQRGEQETQLSWRRLELLDPHVFIGGFWRHDVAINKDGEEAFGPFYSTLRKRRCAREAIPPNGTVAGRASGLIDAFR